MARKSKRIRWCLKTNLPSYIFVNFHRSRFINGVLDLWVSSTCRTKNKINWLTIISIFWRVFHYVVTLFLNIQLFDSSFTWWWIFQTRNYNWLYSGRYCLGRIRNEKFIRLERCIWRWYRSTIVNEKSKK
jgi:hypothetical protein